MQLAEQGTIDLEADINTYLPEGFLHNRVYDTPVTMLNLMNHNAGFEESVIGMATGKEERILPLEEYLLEFQPEQVFEPGTVCAYSNWSTTLAAYVVERVSGVPYYEYVRTNIFEPLEMKDTSICADEEIQQGAAAVYYWILKTIQESLFRQTSTLSRYITIRCRSFCLESMKEPHQIIPG